MFVAMPYVVFMEAMMSHLIHGETFLKLELMFLNSIFCRVVGKGEDGPCGPRLC